MDIHTYLQSKLAGNFDYQLTKEDQNVLDQHGIEAYIYRKLMSKKFRKWSLPESVEEQIKEQIAYCVANKKPVTISLAYGGFKLWRLPTAPEVDWSEFFYIAYHLRYLAPIAKVYEPGAVLSFSSGDIAVSAMNNVPRADVDQYDQSLRTLVAQFQPHLPTNILIEVNRLRDLFDDEQQFIEAGEKLRATARQRFAKDPHYQDEFARGAIQNVQLESGTEDLSQATQAELTERRARSAEVIESMYFIPQIAEHEKRGVINLMATNIAIPIPMITTGTTKYSSAKFWAGLGVMAQNGDGFAEYVVTPKQWDTIKDQKHEVVTSTLIPLKNFKEILVYPKKFNFST